MMECSPPVLQVAHIMLTDLNQTTSPHDYACTWSKATWGPERVEE